jgi:uncharacterized membrane protein YdjX (TVP38/TMEM64 family)
VNEPTSEPKRDRWGARSKALLLFVFLMAAVCIVRFTPVKGFFTQEFLNQTVDRAGIWAPLIFVMIYAAGVCLFVPGTLLTALGAALFGPYRGFLYVWMGAMMGAAAAFWIGRTLGREFAALLVGERLKKYDDAIGRNGFATVLYLRLVYFPFTVLNFGMGLTNVRFRDYFLATGLGILVGTFVLIYFVGTLKDVWAAGNWSQLVSWRMFLSMALFVFSFFIPTIVKKFRSENR